MPSASQMSRWARANQTRLLTTGVAILIIGLSAWVGIRARAAATALSARRTTWDVTASQLSTVQQQFRVPSTTESAALLAESSRMAALAVPPDEKLNLVDMIGRLAEASALTAVRVNLVAVSDSAVIPPRDVVGSTIKPAPYALAVEFVGSFANAQKFVSSLPPSVSLSRLTATRNAAGAQYQLVLSVYETDANSGD